MQIISVYPELPEFTESRAAYTRPDGTEVPARTVLTVDAENILELVATHFHLVAKTVEGEQMLKNAG